MHYVMETYRPTRLRNLSTRSDAVPLYEVVEDARRSHAASLNREVRLVTQVHVELMWYL